MPTAVHFPSDIEPAALKRLAALPKAAQFRFEALKKIEVRARALREGLAVELERVRDERDDALRALAHHDQLHAGKIVVVADEKTGARRSLPAYAEERAAKQADVDRLTLEMERLRGEQAASWPGFSTADILSFLAEQPPSAHYIVVSPKLPKGDATTATLQRVRDAQAELTAEIAAVQNAQRTATEAKAAARDEIALLAERGRPDVLPLLDGQPAGWPTEQFVAGGHGAHQFTVAATVKDAFALVIWANRDAILRAVEAEIDRVADDSTALSAEDQVSRTNALQAELVGLRHQEETLIQRLEQQGQFVPRCHSDPLVLLGIAPGTQ